MAERVGLAGSVAVVTGASSGIGRATALALASRGARLALAARSADALDQTRAQIEALGAEAIAVPTDVTDQEAAESLVARTVAHWGRLDVLVAGAGVYIRCPVCELTAAHLERSMAVNFYGVLYSVMAALPHMTAQGSGHLVLVSSMDGKIGLTLDAPYVAAKFGVVGLGEVMRQELRPLGIGVTTVCPGRVDTPMIARLRVPWISPKVSPDVVARGIVRAIERNRAEVIVPARSRLLIYARLLSPSLFDRLARTFHLEGWETGGS